jgi:hypothetical protein
VVSGAAHDAFALSVSQCGGTRCPFVCVYQRQRGDVPRCAIYIMRRTQLYLEDELWEALHAQADTQKTTVSDLVRQTLREHYCIDFEKRRKAMRDFIGSRADAPDDSDAVEQTRHLRRSDRLERLGG